MMTVETKETPDLGEVSLKPQIEDWRRKLERTCRHLLPWACSAQTLPLWVSDYGKVCRLAGALNAKIDDLFRLTSQDFGIDEAADASVVAEIDQTIDEIGHIGRRIETELHHSIGPSARPTSASRPHLHRQMLECI